MASINEKMNNSFGYVTNPQSADKKQSTVDKMKADQDAKAQSLFVQLQEQREVYENAKKSLAQAKSLNHKLKAKAESYQGSNYLRQQNQEKYEASSQSLDSAESTRDAELRRLESYTDNYCSAQKLAMHISIFAN